MDWLEFIQKLWKKRPLRPYLFTVAIAIGTFFYVNSKHDEAMGEIRRVGVGQESASDRIFGEIQHVGRRVDDLYKLLAKQKD